MLKTSQIQIGHRYEVQAGRNKTTITIVGYDDKKLSWLCETPSGKTIKIKDISRFLKEIGEKKTIREIIESKGVTVIPKEEPAKVVDAVPEVDVTPKHLGPKPLGNMSILSAAHRVLLEAGKPMKVQEIMEAALATGYCKVGGKTPFNTFNGGIRSDITKKGKESRFKRVDKGLFAVR